MGEKQASLPSLLAVDRLVHEPSRLVILAALSEVGSAEFLFLQKLTGLTRGNLSAQAQKLEAAEYLGIEKAFRGKIPVTTLHITPRGRAALQAYRDHFQRLLDQGVLGEPGAKQAP